MSSDGKKDEAAEGALGGVTNEVAESASRKTINPYDLSSSDNLGALISHVLLKHDNYDDWTRELRTPLRARKKFGFVDGTIKRPAENSMILEDWWTNQSFLVSWIQKTIDSSLRSNISHYEVAQELWDDIKEQFSVVNGPRIQKLKGELITCKQDNMTISSYYGRLKRLWENLGDYEKSGACTCGGCTCGKCTCGGFNCGSKAREARKREDDKVHQFFWGLDKHRFGVLKTVLLSRDLLPTINEAFSTVQREETTKTKTRDKEHAGDIVGFAVGTSQARGQRDKMSRSLVCSHCGRNGHEKDRCFRLMSRDLICSNCGRNVHEKDKCDQLIGFPENWGERGPSSLENRFDSRNASHNCITSELWRMLLLLVFRDLRRWMCGIGVRDISLLR